MTCGVTLRVTWAATEPQTVRNRDAVLNHPRPRVFCCTLTATEGKSGGANSELQLEAK